MNEKQPDPLNEHFTGKITTNTGTFGRLREFFSDIRQNVSGKWQSKKASDQDQQEKFREEYKKQIEEQNKRLDEKTIKSTREFIIEFLNKNMNRTYYDERKADVFFEKVFAL